MIVTVSGGAEREAARAAATLDLDSITERVLAAGATGFSNFLVMIPARAGRLFLGVTGAAVPNTFSERHAGSFHRATAISATTGARHVPVSREQRRIRDEAERRELRCGLLPA